MNIDYKSAILLKQDQFGSKFHRHHHRHVQRLSVTRVSDFYSASALPATQSAVIARGIPSVRP